MRAITYTRFGPSEDVLTLSNVEKPGPGDGEVLVRLHCSGVNPSDAKARAGTRPGVTRPAFPKIIPHSDGAGVIEAVGLGVDPARIGQRVWIWNGQWQRAFGTAAEFISINQDQAVALPENVSFETGAALGIPAMTAAHCVFSHGPVAGKTVLISGAAGSVGHLAVQLAKWGGATVVATANGNEGCARAKTYGADFALDYSSPTLAEDILRATSGNQAEFAIEVEFGSNIEMLAEIIAPNGIIMAYGSAREMSPTLPFGPLLFKAVTIDIALIYLLRPAERERAISYITKALAENALAPEIHANYPLEECAQAHRDVETGGRKGAVILSIR